MMYCLLPAVKMLGNKDELLGLYEKTEWHVCSFDNQLYFKRLPVLQVR